MNNNNWLEKKKLIKSIETVKENLLETHLNELLNEKENDDAPQKVEIIKNLKNVLVKNNVESWNDELNEFAIGELTKKLLKLCQIDLIKLKLEYQYIDERLSKNNETDVDVNADNNENNDRRMVMAKEMEENKEFKQFLVYLQNDVKLNDEAATTAAKFEETDKTLDYIVKYFINKIKPIIRLKSTIEESAFLIGHDNFNKLVLTLSKHLTLDLLSPAAASTTADDSSSGNNVTTNKIFTLDLFTQIFSLIPNAEHLNKIYEIITNYNLAKWIWHLTMSKIENDLELLLQKFVNTLKVVVDVEEKKKIIGGGIDEHVEKQVNEFRDGFRRTKEEIIRKLITIEFNKSLNSKEKELFLKFISDKLCLELKKDGGIGMIKINELNSVISLLVDNNFVIEKLIEGINESLSSSLELNNAAAAGSLGGGGQEDEICSFINAIRYMPFDFIKTYLLRFWIVDELRLDERVLDEEQEKIIQYLEIIKSNTSESTMTRLVRTIKVACEQSVSLPLHVIDTIKNFSNQNWILNEETLDILAAEEKSNFENWLIKMDAYTKEKRLKKRDLLELIRIMKKDANNLNKSIKFYLDDEERVLNDVKVIKDSVECKLSEMTPVGSSSSCSVQEKVVRIWSESDVKEWAVKAKGSRLLSDVNRVREAITVFYHAFYLHTTKIAKTKNPNGTGYYLRDAQLLAIWLFLNPQLTEANGCLAQIATGEGKSIIVVGLAIIKALSCHKVDVITSSPVLACRDAEEFKEFFETFGLQVTNNCDHGCETDEKIRKLRYNTEKGPVDVIYGEVGCFERDVLLSEFNKSESDSNIIGNRLSGGNAVSSVIIDEVDSMLLDKASMVLYLSHNIDGLKSLERVFLSIWQTVNQPTMAQVRAFDEQTIALVAEMIQELVDNGNVDVSNYDTGLCDYVNLKTFVRRRMPIWVKSAFQVKEMAPNDSYIVSKDLSNDTKNDIKITVMDKDTGTEQLSTRWSNGVHQFLQLKHARRLTPESLKAVFISNMTYFKRYGKNIVGLTGSIGSNTEQAILDDVYKVKFFELPRFKAELFKQLPANVYTNEQTWLDGIKKAVDKQIKNKEKSSHDDKQRAVLIICENVKTVINLKDYLKSSYPNAREYKSSYEKFDIDKLRPGDVIIATNLAGRGTDLPTSEKLEENGGLHVIITYLPNNLRIEMQGFGRTARKGNNGTGEYVIMNKYGLSIEKLKQMRDNNETERLQRFLSHDLPKIKMEEDLLKGFDDGENSCIGFATLFANVQTELKRQGHENEYISIQLYSLKNRWAYWLDSMSELINMINAVGKRKIVEKFNEFKTHVESDMLSSRNGLMKFIKEPSEMIKLGRFYRTKDNWSNAIICFEEASKDPFYSYAKYYTSACLQNKNYGRGLDAKHEFKKNLIIAKKSIEKELNFCVSAGQVAFEIAEKNRKSEGIGFTNEFEKQVKEKAGIWNIFSNTITIALGSEIDAKEQLSGNKYLSDEKKGQELLNYLESKKWIKPFRISKKAFKKSGGDDDNDKLVLPGIFNNDKTCSQLKAFLIMKREERENGSGTGRLDQRVLEDYIRANNVFIPHLDIFINEMRVRNILVEREEFSFDSNLPAEAIHSFLQTLPSNLLKYKNILTINDNQLVTMMSGTRLEIIKVLKRGIQVAQNNNLEEGGGRVSTKEVGELFDFFLSQNLLIRPSSKLDKFSFSKFDENELNKKSHYPDEIRKNKEHLWKCASSLAGSLNGCTVDFIKETIKTNIKIETKNKLILLDSEVDSFYEFLVENNCIEPAEAFSVNFEMILMPKLNKENVKEFKYVNHYDFEKHYTKEFNQLPEAFKRNLMQTLVIQEEEENVNEEGEGEPYLTLRDTICLNEFQVPKTLNESVECIWGYLKSNNYIKGPKVNIGLIPSDKVEKNRDTIKDLVKKYTKDNLGVVGKEVDEATNTIFEMIYQTVGELKKLPDTKTICSFPNIEQTYFLDNKEHVPESLNEFIELALDVVFKLEEKKEPPKWYDILGCILLGIAQIVLGVLAKMFIPVAGEMIGNFLISTGTDDIVFGIQSAISGEFSWKKYWEHKKVSLITAAICAVVCGGCSFLNNANKLKSFSKAWQLQKLTKVEKLQKAASVLGKSVNVVKSVGKEIGKTVFETTINASIDVGIEKLLDKMSILYDDELGKNIEKSVSGKWNAVDKEIEEIYRLLEGSDQAKSIIEDCVQRKIKILSQEKRIEQIMRYASPVMSGLGNGLSAGGGGKASFVGKLLSHAPKLINLGINIEQMATMVSDYIESLANDLKDARMRLTNINKDYVLQESQLNEIKNFQDEKKKLIVQELKDEFQKKLKGGILLPVVNYATSKAISMGVEFASGKVFNSDHAQIEQLADDVEMMQAVMFPEETKFKYLDKVNIFRTQAEPVDLEALHLDPKTVYPENCQTAGTAKVNIEQLQSFYGDKLKLFKTADGRYIVQRPSTKEFCQSVRGDKAAGLHEQAKISEILGFQVLKGTDVNGEQKCTIKHDGGKEVDFIIKTNKDGSKHAELLVNGQPISINSNLMHKNDCYYNVALIANEMSKGADYSQAIKMIFDNKNNSVNNLRKDVSIALRSDKTIMNEFRWVKQHLSSSFGAVTSLNHHLKNLVGTTVLRDVDKRRDDLLDELHTFYDNHHENGINFDQIQHLIDDLSNYEIRQIITNKNYEIDRKIFDKSIRDRLSYFYGQLFESTRSD